MKPNEGRNVHGRPDARTAASASIIYRVTTLLVSPPSMELLDTKIIRFLRGVSRHSSR
jgi:hypothetical protein